MGLAGGLHLNTGSGFSTTSTNWTVPFGGYISGANGYGFFQTNSGNSSTTNSLTWSTMDMNGDAKPDLVVTAQGIGAYGPSFGVGSSPYWKVYLNSGTGFSTTSINWTMPDGGYISGANGYGFYELFSGNSSTTNSLTWSTIDINGDALPDLVVTAQGIGTYGPGFGVGTNPYWKVYLNSGGGFSTTSFNWTLPAGGYISGSNGYGFYTLISGSSSTTNSLGWSTMDMNGDAKPDLVVTAQGIGSYAPSFGVGSNPYWKVYLNTSTWTALNEDKITPASFCIYPNPFQSQSSIEFSEAQQNTEIKIMDMLGHEIQSFFFSGKQSPLDLQTVKPGLYILQTKDNRNKIEYKKIVLE